MPTIAVSMYPGVGGVNATLKLVRDLRERGHTVHYFGLADCQDYLGDESFFPVFTKSFPRRAGPRNDAQPLSFLPMMRLRRFMSKRADTFVSGLCNDRYEGFDSLMASLQPDLIIIQAHTFYAALWGLLAYRFAIPCVLLNDCLSGPENALVPPISCSLQPRPGVSGRMATRFHWKLLGFKKQLVFLYERLLYNWDQGAIVRRLADSFEYPADLIDEHEKFYLRTRAPEIVLVPESFDFDHRVQSAGRYYAGASVDVNRKESSFPWQFLNPTLPLVFCSLGTIQYYDAQKYRRFFERVIEAFAPISEDFQLVIAAFDHCNVTGLGDGVKNILVTRQAPQLELLKRAALMITHAGSNSVKECLTLGVPMLMCPLASDQFGFSVRALAKGVGLRIDFRRSTVEIIRDRMRRLLHQPYYRLQARRVMHEFALAEETESAADCIETFLSARSVAMHAK